jgi:hypothetical protein
MTVGRSAQATVVGCRYRSSSLAAARRTAAIPVGLPGYSG